MSLPKRPNAGARSAASATAQSAFKRGRKTLAERLQEIIAQQQQLDDIRRELMARQRMEKREREAQIDGIIGAALRADASCREFLRAALEKNIQDPKSRALLRSEGLLTLASNSKE